ncbi:MAG: tRNA (adenosine(37)-N6)-threonylcarbamoyltransferase complex ATPase subunit type 1 TsaE [Brevinematales bacterium]|nr:tRNA (adenosine(37)-N6)-threonylcarbamoyltransferase complex ATPase subunit type 1 TsaE [Brevinematales bacterium]
MSIKFLSKSISETFDLGRKFATGEIVDLSRIKIFLLQGELGSGKTSFVRGFCSHFGLDTLVSSPSFTIINEYYNERIKILHIDFYRVKSVEELTEIGFYELFDNSDFVFIEWPEMIEKSLANNFCILKFFYGEEEGYRLIEMEE